METHVRIKDFKIKKIKNKKKRNKMEIASFCKSTPMDLLVDFVILHQPT